MCQLADYYSSRGHPGRHCGTGVIGRHQRVVNMETRSAASYWRSSKCQRYTTYIFISLIMYASNQLLPGAQRPVPRGCPVWFLLQLLRRGGLARLRGTQHGQGLLPGGGHGAQMRIISTIFYRMGGTGVVRSYRLKTRWTAPTLTTPARSRGRRSTA